MTNQKQDTDQPKNLISQNLEKYNRESGKKTLLLVASIISLIVILILVIILLIIKKPNIRASSISNQKPVKSISY